MNNFPFTWNHKNFLCRSIMTNFMSMVSNRLKSGLIHRFFRTTKTEPGFQHEPRLQNLTKDVILQFTVEKVSYLIPLTVPAWGFNIYLSHPARSSKKKVLISPNQHILSVQKQFSHPVSLPFCILTFTLTLAWWCLSTIILILPCL